jgi:hypothetical protein
VTILISSWENTNFSQATYDQNFRQKGVNRSSGGLPSGQKKGHEVSFCARYGCARRGVRTYGLLCAVGIKRFIYGELQDSRGAEPATSINSPNTPIPTTNMMRSPMINISVRCVTESMRKPPCYWNYYRPGFDGLTYGVTPFSCR